MDVSLLHDYVCPSRQPQLFTASSDGDYLVALILPSFSGKHLFKRSQNLKVKVVGVYDGEQADQGTLPDHETISLPRFTLVAGAVPTEVARCLSTRTLWCDSEDSQMTVVVKNLIVLFQLVNHYQDCWPQSDNDTGTGSRFLWGEIYRSWTGNNHTGGTTLAELAVGIVTHARYVYLLEVESHVDHTMEPAYPLFALLLKLVQEAMRFSKSGKPAHILLTKGSLSARRVHRAIAFNRLVQRDRDSLFSRMWPAVSKKSRIPEPSFAETLLPHLSSIVDAASLIKRNGPYFLHEEEKHDYHAVLRFVKWIDRAGACTKGTGRGEDQYQLLGHDCRQSRGEVDDDTAQRIDGEGAMERAPQNRDRELYLTLQLETTCAHESNDVPHACCFLFFTARGRLGVNIDVIASSGWVAKDLIQEVGRRTPNSAAEGRNDVDLAPFLRAREDEGEQIKSCRIRVSSISPDSQEPTPLRTDVVVSGRLEVGDELLVGVENGWNLDGPFASPVA